MSPAPTLDVNVENEQIALATLLKDRELRDAYAPRLREEQFQAESHKALLVALQTLAAKGAESEPDSIVQLSGEAVSLKYLRGLDRDFEALPESNLKLHLGLLERDQARANVREPFDRLYAAMDDPHADLVEIDTAAREISRMLRAGALSSELVREKHAWEDVVEDLEDCRAGRQESFRPTQFRDLDSVLTEGFRAGKLTVVAGRPGMGKSTLAANLVLRAKLRSNLRILACPFEDKRQAMVERIGCARGRVNALRMIQSPAKLTDEEMFRFKRAVREVCGDGQITFLDEVDGLDGIESVLSTGDFDLVFLDLFDYLLPPKVEPTEITDALRRLRNLSKPDKRRGWQGFHTVAFHQIRRIEKSERSATSDKRPTLQGLKNSGGYEEVPDNVFLLYREKYYVEDSEDDVIEINIAKQRRGAMNVVVGYELEPQVCRVGKNTRDFHGASDLERIRAELEVEGA